MTDLTIIGKKAKAAARSLRSKKTGEKNEALLFIAEELVKNTHLILEENKKDIENAKEKNISTAMLDRLSLSAQRIEGIADGIREVAALPDPVGEILSMNTLPNGLKVGKRRVALGVVGVIYESRPNVTADTASLCLKASNAVILRGGSDAFYSNRIIASIMRNAIEKKGFNPDCISFIEDTSRETATKLMRLNEYVDVLIPRGGSGLINSVVMNSTVPVIETGVGNCHIYIDKSADEKKAVSIAVNAKTSRPSVCNAAETLLIHKDVPEKIIVNILSELKKNNVEIRGCEKTNSIFECSKIADEEDFKTEFLDYIIAVRIVDSIEAAIEHIEKYSTGHSECIVTENYSDANLFLDEIDSAAVYVNASTRFTDGNEFGLGAEIGISTQKLHARGPMGLKELTTTKYIILGNGQIR